MVKVGINGFGRIGRLVFRNLLSQEDIEVVCINDLAATDILAHLFQYDSVHGRFLGRVKYDKEHIYVHDKPVRVCSQSNPSALPWRLLGVSIVLECTVFLQVEKAQWRT